MGDLHSAPAEAYAPDPDRADPDSPDLMPEWLAYLIALVIVFLLEQFQAARQRVTRRPASRHVGRPALPRDSAQPPAAAIRSRPDHTAARTHRGSGIAPTCADLLRARTELLEKLRQTDVDPSVLSQLEALGIVPSPIGPDTAVAPTAPSPTAPALAPLCIANIRRDPRRSVPAGTQHRALPTPRRQMFTRPGTGPPTGPPAVSDCQSCCA
ncbi:MAG TPA: hypothetical protein VGG99_21350 [Acetobacteraceae bacterium]|jgi:hypothetical protein